MPSQVIGRIGQDTPYLCQQPPVGRMTGRDGERLGNRDGPTTAQWHDLGDRPAIYRDGQPLTTFDPAEHLADRVAQVPN